jgi:Protein of unknown function (DUF3175)
MADSHGNSHGKRKWSAAVTTDSTQPGTGFSIRAQKQLLVSSHPKRFRPRDLRQACEMLTFYINRAGKNLPAARLKVLENAKTLLHQKILADTKKANSRAA